MNLINKKLLAHKIQSFEFPSQEKINFDNNLLQNWIKALKNSDLEKTKEKSVQGKFLNTFFEVILGYNDITSGLEEWTLIQHPRIENDNKEPDGSLGWFTKDKKNTKVVIELKDAKTQLDKKQNRGIEKLTPIEQAYLYSTKYEGCNWIIVSNFKEIRLYNKDKPQEYYEKFDILNLVEESEFKRFYFLFCKDNLISKTAESTIDILAKDTTETEQDITKKFYKEYKQVRLNLLNHLIENNLDINKEVLLEKTQKILDRFIFTLFCEDTSKLLPRNIILDTYDRALNSFSASDERVWTELKGLFQAIDKGNSRVKPPINAYNGGLFASDNILDRLVIKDEFWVALMNLPKYDFDTDLNVNILGHIFEQSISDLENLKQDLKGEELNKSKSKRKKDGIYYTPEYITRYMVENTVGKFLEEYPTKLETVKILDPACGSGAFLNQTHSFLLNQYQIRHEEHLSNKTTAQLSFEDINIAETNKSILLNNLYGVDLNQESVEITKLSLWLKTARSTEPLQNLDKNIKCGNSLINDSEIVGEKAFIWENEYKDIIESGKFDIVIGNPPYVNGIILQRDIPQQREWLKNHYKTLIEKWDLYIAFIEKGLSLLKSGGYFSFIVPDAVLTEKYAQKLQQYILEHFNLIQIDYFPGIYIFEGVGVHNVIFTIKNEGKTNEVKKIKHLDLLGSKVYKIEIIPEKIFSDYDDNEINISAQNVDLLEDIVFISKGLVLNSDEKKYKGEFIKKDLISNTKDETHSKKLFEGEDIHKYYAESSKYVEWNTQRVPFRISRPTFIELYQSNKLLTNKIGELKVALDKNGDICDQTVRILLKWEQLKGIENTSINNSVSKFANKDRLQLEAISAKYKLEYLLGVLNSKFINYYFKNLRGNRSIDINPLILRQIPIAKATDEDQKQISDRVQNLMDLYNQKEQLQKLSCEFILSEYKTKLNNKNFLTLGWNELNEILNKSKIDLTVNQKEELFSWFKAKQLKLQELQNQINSLSNHIDKVVYGLYKLSEEDIKIVETATL